jgi:hypothetical protein
MTRNDFTCSFIHPGPILSAKIAGEADIIVDQPNWIPASFSLSLFHFSLGLHEPERNALCLKIAQTRMTTGSAEKSEASEIRISAANNGV